MDIRTDRPVSTSDWRSRLYASYVSSGQGGTHALAGFSKPNPYLNRVISTHVPKDTTAAILDLGCGAGGMLHCLKQRGYRNVRGVDLSREMVDLAHKNGIPEVEHGDLHDTLARTPERSVDVCLAMDILEHLDRQELFDVCDGIFRILKGGGRIILHVPNAGGIFGSVIRFGDLTHENAFTEVSVRQLLSTTGFVDVRSYEDKPIPHGAKSLLRLVLWETGTAGFRLLYAAETGLASCILSQNLLSVARKPST